MPVIFRVREFFHVLSRRNLQSKQSKTKTLGIFFPSHPLTKVTGATVKASNSHLILTFSVVRWLITTVSGF
jgi:hypothetical protein